ncbi:LacI family DNA-binding transcriptional regulator [Parvularcula dongshanensis]|nr:substrate-binding domain-containing protein [Parvularcula dongshanensis]
MSVIVMVPDLSNPFFGSILSGIERVATENDYAMLVVNTHDEKAVEERCIDHLGKRRVDGVIQLGARPGEELISDVRRRSLPFIHAIESTLDTTYPTVTVDNVAAASEIATHLTSLGHREFGIVGGPFESAITVSRMKGYQKAIEAVGGDWAKVPRAYGPFTLASGEASAVSILHQHPEVTALICMSDELAMGAIKGAFDLGISVPEKLSVVGFDNIPASGYFIPTITTVTQPASKLGSLSMTMLVATLAKQNVPRPKTVLHADLVIRRSTRRLVGV